MGNCSSCNDIFLSNDEHKICKRCFDIKHYSKTDFVNYSTTEYKLDNEEIFYVISAFDLQDIPIYTKYTLVVNRCNLLPHDLTNEKLLNYLKKTHKKAIEIILIKNSVVTLLNAIKGKNIVFLGKKNVGKSYLINRMLKTNLIESKYFGGNLKHIKININNNYIIDTVGLNNVNFNILPIDYYRNIIPLKPIIPKIIQNVNNRVIIIGGIGALMIRDANMFSIILNFSTSLIYHKTSTNKVEDIILNHNIDILKYPYEIDMSESLKFDSINKLDVWVSSIGFISFIGRARVEFRYKKGLELYKMESVI